MPRLVSEVGRSTAPRKLPALLAHVYSETGRFSFLQVGANDGKVNDALGSFIGEQVLPPEVVSGTCLEPQEGTFETLVANYRWYPHVACYNVALSDKDERRTLYNIHPRYLDNPRIRKFGTRLASFYRPHIIKHWEKFAPWNFRYSVPSDNYISSEEVECLTFETLAGRAGIEAFDMLFIDTEGFDAEVLRMVDLNKFRVRAVVLEHKHLSRADKAYCYRRLKDEGFQVWGGTKDLWGVRACPVSAGGSPDIRSPGEGMAAAKV